MSRKRWPLGLPAGLFLWFCSHSGAKELLLVHPPLVGLLYLCSLHITCLNGVLSHVTTTFALLDIGGTAYRNHIFWVMHLQIQLSVRFHECHGEKNTKREGELTQFFTTKLECSTFVGPFLFF